MCAYIYIYIYFINADEFPFQPHIGQRESFISELTHPFHVKFISNFPVTPTKGLCALQVINEYG